MKRLEDYISVARSFNAGLKNDLDLTVVEKQENNQSNYTKYIFNDGVAIGHSWDGGSYGFGYKDYDHDIEVINDAGYEFEQKSLSYGMKRSSRL